MDPLWATVVKLHEVGCCPDIAICDGTPIHHPELENLSLSETLHNSYGIQLTAAAFAIAIISFRDARVLEYLGWYQVAKSGLGAVGVELEFLEVRLLRKPD